MLDITQGPYLSLAAYTDQQLRCSKHEVRAIDENADTDCQLVVSYKKIEAADWLDQKTSGIGLNR